MMGEKDPAVGGGWALVWEEGVFQSPGVSPLRAPLIFVRCQRRKNRGKERNPLYKPGHSGAGIERWWWVAVCQQVS